MNLNWSSPTPNYFKALRLLLSALQSGENARIVKVLNEDCPYPIREKFFDGDFRNYKFSYGCPATFNELLMKNDFKSKLSLEYVVKFGTAEAVENYYTNGVLSDDNFKGVGRSHLVKVTDLIDFYEAKDDFAYAQLYRSQYINQTPEDKEKKHMFDFFTHKYSSEFKAKKFSKKIYAIELLNKKEIVKLSYLTRMFLKIISILKYVPKKSVLQMKEYRNVTYRIGGVINGFSIEFHIPKKFSLK